MCWSNDITFDFVGIRPKKNPPLNKLDCNVLLWNTEGIKNAMDLAPPDILHNYDLAIFTETFIMDNWNHPLFYSTHVLAKKGDKGRPAGGISVLMRPWMTPIIRTIRKENAVLIVTKELAIIAAYYPPNHSALEILEEIHYLIQQIKHEKPTIIAGDLNCRIDKKNSKTKLVVDALEEEGFTLLNDRNTPTYICHNGSSAIDLSPME